MYFLLCKCNSRRTKAISLAIENHEASKTLHTTEELVLELERFRQLTRSRRRDGRRRSERRGGFRHHGVGVSVGYGIIDFHGDEKFV